MPLGKALNLTTAPFSTVKLDCYLLGVSNMNMTENIAYMGRLAKLKRNIKRSVIKW